MRRTITLGPDDILKAAHRFAQTIIDDDEIEFQSARDLFLRGPNSGINVAVFVLSPCNKPLFQYFQGRRQNKHGNGAGVSGLKLFRALDVYIQEHVVSGGEFQFRVRSRRSIKLAMNDGMLQKFAAGYHGLKALPGNEVVFAAVGLFAPRRARGIGYRKPQAPVAFDESAADG